MTKEALQQLKARIDERFKNEKLKHDQLEQQTEDSAAELNRLQGEFRAVKALIELTDKEAEARAVKVKDEGKTRG